MCGRQRPDHMTYILYLVWPDSRNLHQ